MRAAKEGEHVAPNTWNRRRRLGYFLPSFWPGSVMRVSTSHGQNPVDENVLELERIFAPDVFCPVHGKDRDEERLPFDYPIIGRLFSSVLLGS